MSRQRLPEPYGPSQSAMAMAWYSNRLSVQAHRPDSNEIRQIFARIGLTDAFWDPRADKF